MDNGSRRAPISFLPPVTKSNRQHRILIADDQPDVLEALRLLLKGEGYQTEAVSSPNPA